MLISPILAEAVCFTAVFRLDVLAVIAGVTCDANGREHVCRMEVLGEDLPARCGAYHVGTQGV